METRSDMYYETASMHVLEHLAKIQTYFFKENLPLKMNMTNIQIRKP